MSLRAVVATVGVSVVVLYAALMAVDALVLYPLAAVPGRTLGQIYAELVRADMNVTLDIWAVLVMAGIGVVLALVAAIVGLRRRRSAPYLAIVFLGILAAGAFPTFYSGIFLGMDIADTFAPSDSADTIWPDVLFITSLVALLAIPVIALVAARRRRQLAPA